LLFELIYKYNKNDMEMLSKAVMVSEGEQITFTLPISKVDKERRIVSGWATLDNVDKQNDRVLAEASTKAFERFRGNVRLMHQPIPAGKVVNFKQDQYYDKESNKFYSGIFVDAYVSKGAENIWEMVLDGTLTGFSIGGAVKDTEKVYDAGTESTVRIIKDYDLVELSLVDNPANQFANIFSIQKVNDSEFADGIFNKSDIENVFWCESDQKAILSKEEVASCSFCKEELVSIGWVDNIGKDVDVEIKSLINKYYDKLNFIKREGDVIDNEDTINRNPRQGKLKDEMYKKVSRGAFVSWGSSGGTARGKVVRVVRNGKIKVPGSSFTITGTPDNPAVLIRVYRKTKDGWNPSDTLVGHKMDTLRQISPLSKGYKDKDKMKKSEDAQIKGGASMSQENETTEEVVVEETVAVTDEAAEIVEAFEDEVAGEETPETESEEAPAEEITKSDEAEEEKVEAQDAPAEESPAEEEASEDEAESEASAEDELSKSLAAVKEFISDTVAKSEEANTGRLSEVVNVVSDLAKTLNEKLAEVKTQQADFSKALAGVKGLVDSINNRVEAVEDTTAVKKSGELGDSPEVEEPIRKSVWGGRFLATADMLKG
jgi:hypothetical protein